MADRRIGTRVEIAGNAAGGVDAFKQVARASKDSATVISSDAQKVASDLGKVETAAANAAKANQKLSAPSIARSSATGFLQGQVSGTRVSGAVDQLGGVEKLLGGISTKAVVATAGVTALAAGAVAFGKSAVTSFRNAAEQVDQFQDVAGGSAENASKFVAVGQQLGVSTSALAQGFKVLAQNADKNEESLAALGAQVVRTNNGSVDMVATFESVARAFAATDDPVRRANIGTLAFGRSWQSLIDVLERGGSTLDKAFSDAANHAPILSQDELNRAKEFSIKMEEISQSINKVKVEAGARILEHIQDDVAGVQALIDKLHELDPAKIAEEKSKAGGIGGVLARGFAEANQAISDEEHRLAGQVGDVLRSPLDLARGVEGIFKNTGHAVRETAAATAATADQWAQADAAFLGAGRSADEARAAVERIRSAAVQASQEVLTYAESLARANAEFAAATSSTRTQHDVTADYATAVAQLDSYQEKATGSTSQLGDAQERAAQQISDAQKSVQDALAGVNEARAEAAKVAEDNSRRIADVEESTARKVTDAQDRVTEARKRADDQLKSSARRVEDARQALADAMTEALTASNPFEAQRKREDAQRDLTRAEQDAAAEQADAAKSVADAQGDLARTEKDAAKDRADAQREAADRTEQATKRISDAQGRVSDAQERLDRTATDAAKSIDDAAVSATQAKPSHDQLAGSLQTVVDKAFGVAWQMKQMGASDTEIQAFLDTTKTKVHDFGVEWGFSGDEIAYYNQQVGLIQHTIDVDYVLHLNAQQFLQEMQRAAQQFTDPTTKANLMAGILEPVGGETPLPHFSRDSGGIIPIGTSLVTNATGSPELALNPPQIQNLLRMLDQGPAGGGTQTIVLQVDGRELARVMADGRRRGTLGFG